MSDPSDPPDLGGPLPTVDRFNQNQQRSIVKLNAALPIERLRFRDERIDDCGADGSLEVHASGNATNLRAVIQLKSKETTQPNQDGSISFPADVPNVVYLLNGSSPLYVLYAIDTDLLWFTWVRDEIHRIEVDNPDWRSQGKISLRFSKQMDTSGCDEIWQRVLREGVLARQVFSLISSATKDDVHLAISTSTLSVYSHDDILNLIVTQGLSIVNAGFPSQLIDKSTILSGDERSRASVALVLGYAEYNRGKYAACDAHLVDAKLGEHELSTDQRQLLALLSNACDLELGRIDRDNYLIRESDLIKGASNALQRQHRTRVLWDAYLTDRHPDKIKALTTDLQALLVESEADIGDSQENRLQLSLGLIVAEIDLAISELITLNAQRRMVEQTQLAWIAKAGDTGSQWKAHWDSLTRRLQEISQTAEQLANPIVLARANATLAVSQFQLCIITKLLTIPMDGPMPDFEAIIYGLMDTVERAIKVVATAGVIEEELRFTITLAEMYMAVNNIPGAQQLAGGALQRARALPYERLVARAEPLAKGHWHIRDFEGQLKAIKEEDAEVLAARETDSDIERLSRSTIHALGLPADRLPAIRAEHESIRMLAMEHLSFCRHLHLTQDLSHTRSRQTFYATLPDQAIHCDIFPNRKSSRILKEPRVLVDEFKARYCNTCNSKSPKS